MASDGLDNGLVYDKAEEMIKKLTDFLDKYGHLYPANVLYEIKKYAWSLDPVANGSPTMKQIYAHIGVYPDHENVYRGFVDLVRATVGLSKNIFEMCSGRFPIVSQYIDEEQTRIESGSITASDRNIILSSLGNIKILQKNVYPATRLVGTNVVLAFDACDGVEDAIDVANNNKCEAVISPCHGVPTGDGMNHDCSPEESSKYHSYLYKYFRENLPEGHSLSYVYLNRNYGYPNPIFISQKVK